jgi:hypothetical protein
MICVQFVSHIAGTGPPLELVNEVKEYMLVGPLLLKREVPLTATMLRHNPSGTYHVQRLRTTTTIRISVFYALRAQGRPSFRTSESGFSLKANP